MKKTSLLFLILISAFFNSNAQNRVFNSIDYQKNTSILTSIDHISTPKDFFDKNQQLFQLSESTKMVMKDEYHYGMLHAKFQETYKNLTVFGAIYCLHLNDGFVENANGLIYPNIDVDVNPKFNVLEIQNIANKAFLPKQKDRTNQISETPKLEFEKTELVLIDPIFPKFSGKVVLAYNVIAKNKNDIRQIMIHANNGHIIWQQSLICHIDVPSSGKTKYYGNQSFISDSISVSQFVLKDNLRNITTFKEVNNNLVNLISKTKDWDLTNSNLDEVGIDAHYCTSRFYDMMAEKFNYRGIDGKNSAMNPVIHAQGNEDFLNAYWDGKNAYFGNGDCHHNPLTTLSIVAHEFTHGVTQKNSNLIYDDEPGAINESLSDIFGKGCEYLYDQPNFTWLLDPKMNSSKYASNFRSFSNPNDYKMPKTYFGLHWESGADVHVNSSVFNHWFYLMVTGGKGVSEAGKNFDIQPIPMFEVLKIVFDCQANYLIPTSSYPNLYEFSKLSCEKIYGKTSKQYLSLIDAWLAVGLPFFDPSGGLDIPDLALVINEDDIFVCGTNTKYIESGYIINSGQLPYKKGHTITVNLYSALDIDYESTLTLQKDLLPGDTINLNLPEFTIQDVPGNYYVNWQINSSPDENYSNDDVYKSIYIGENSKNYIELLFATTNLIDCKKSKFLTTGYLNNLSCESVKTGETIKIDHKLNGSIFKTTNIVLDHDFILGENLVYSDTLSLPNIADVVSVVRGSTSQNNSETFIIEKPTISSLVNVKFSNGDYEEYFNYSNYKDPILTIATNDVFATTGSAFRYGLDVPCLDDYRNLKSTQDALKTCLNVSGLGKTKLSFDVNQFRADSLKFPELWDNTSMLLVTLDDGTNIVNKLIKSQSENNWVHHEVVIPDNYNGNLSFSFYNNIGPEDFFITKEILNYDAILLDNVKIEKSTSTENIVENDLQIYPNPSHDFLKVICQSSQQFEGKAFTMDGKLMNVWKNIKNGDQIDISNMPSGMYLIKFLDENNSIRIAHFVKI